jgi:hypothetical protein
VLKRVATPCFASICVNREFDGQGRVGRCRQRRSGTHLPTAAIHPNSRQTKPVPGKYIVMLTLGDMKNLTFAYPVLRRTADGCIEVRLLRLIGTNILRRHPDRNGHFQHYERASKRSVVDVRKDRMREMLRVVTSSYLMNGFGDQGTRPVLQDRPPHHDRFPNPSQGRICARQPRDVDAEPGGSRLC